MFPAVQMVAQEYGMFCGLLSYLKKSKSPYGGQPRIYCRQLKTCGEESACKIQLVRNVMGA